MSSFVPSPVERSVHLPWDDYARASVYFVTIVVNGRACLFGDVIGDEMHLNEAGEMVRQLWRELPSRFSGVGVDAFVVMPNHIHAIIHFSEPVVVPHVGSRDGSARGIRNGSLDRRTTTRVAPMEERDASVRGIRNGSLDRRATTRVAPTGEGDNAARSERNGISERRATGDNSPRATARVAPKGNHPHTLGDVIETFKSLTNAGYARGVEDLGWSQFAGDLWQQGHHQHAVRSDVTLAKVRQYVHENPGWWARDKENPLSAHNARSDG